MLRSCSSLVPLWLTSRPGLGVGDPLWKKECAGALGPSALGRPLSTPPPRPAPLSLLCLAPSPSALCVSASACAFLISLYELRSCLAYLGPSLWACLP